MEPNIDSHASFSMGQKHRKQGCGERQANCLTMVLFCQDLELDVCDCKGQIRFRQNLRGSIRKKSTMAGAQIKKGSQVERFQLEKHNASNMDPLKH